MKYEVVPSLEVRSAPNSVVLCGPDQVCDVWDLYPAEARRFAYLLLLAASEAEAK